MGNKLAPGPLGGATLSLFKSKSGINGTGYPSIYSPAAAGLELASAAHWKRQGREWVHLTPPLYYLYQDPNDKHWRVIDRSWDVSVGIPAKTKRGAIRSDTGVTSRCKVQGSFGTK